MKFDDLKSAKSRAAENVPRPRRAIVASLILTVCLMAISAPSASAQTRSDKPFDARSRTALVEELKGIVSRTELDEKNAAMVAEKWDMHKDLAGKTKTQLVDLLYVDVKSVIKDSGSRYQIYSIFSFYKTIPDESFSSKSPKTKGPISKLAAVAKLVDLTYRMHPYVGVEEQLALLPGSPTVKADGDEERKNRIAGFNDALKVNRQLTPDQKTFVTSNYDRLIKMTDKITEDAIKTNFPTERWVKEGLQKSYTSNFTPSELTRLIAYFQGAPSQQYLKYVRTSNMAQMIAGNGGTLDLTEADKTEHDKFVGTSLGKKFNAAYLDDAIAYEKSKETVVRSRFPNADGFAIYEPENLNKLFNKFVAANYKKQV